MNKLFLHGITYTTEVLSESAYFDHENPIINLAHQWLTGNPYFTFKTSGSTGVPKEINFTRKQVVASIQRTIRYFDLKPSDHFYCALSVTTIAGGMMLLRALELGADITFETPSSKVLEAIPPNHPFTFGSFVPMQLNGISENKQMQENLQRFSVLLIGGAAIPSSIENYFLNTGKLRAFQTYGMTETLSHVAVRELGKADSYTVLPGIEIKTDLRNCLCIRADITNGEWITTNDIVTPDKPNSFHLSGRIDRVINSGGVKVNPEKVEHAMSKWLTGLNFFVCGTKDFTLGEKVTLVVEGNRLPDLQKLREQTASNLNAFEFPRNCIGIPSFVYTESGKTDRQKTMNLYLQTEK